VLIDIGYTISSVLYFSGIELQTVTDAPWCCYSFF